MDWRERDYYLIQFDSWSENMRRRYFEIVAPSIKYHAPYGHFKDSWWYSDKWISNRDYDGLVRNAGRSLNRYRRFIFYPQYMISCRKEESEDLEYELSKADRNDWHCTQHHIKLTKEMTGQ